MEPENKIQRYEPVSRALERARTALPVRYETVEMEETPELLAYWRVIRKRRWIILTILFIVFILGLIGTLKQKPTYRAAALLEIEKENPNILTVQELFELETVSDTYLETQYKILQSSSLARRVIDHLGLDQRDEFKPPKRWWGVSRRRPKKLSAGETFAVAGAVAERDPEAYQNAVEQFQKRLRIEPVKRSRLVEVSFESTDPELAARVVNSLAANYIERSLEVRWEATQKAAEWISQQLMGMKARLEKSEDELQQYAREEGLLFLETESGEPENIANERLRQLQEALTAAQAERFAKEALYRLVEEGHYGALPGVFENKLMQDLTVRVAELKRERAQLATTFTPDYPKVKQIHNQIEELEAVLAHERERAAQRIRNDYRAAVERENLLRRTFEAQQVQANRIAERSVQYNILKREVDTNKQLYEGLLQRLREAGVSAGLKSTNIRIVDAAAPPEKPARPKVVLNLALALIVGLGLGVGAAFLQEYLDNTLKTPDDVERYLRVASLGLIPAVDSLNHRRGRTGGLSERGKWLASGAASPANESAGRETLAVKGPGGWTWRTFWAERFEKRLGRAGSSLGEWLRIDADGHHHWALLEAFRSLRTSVLLSTAEGPPRSLLISSSRPSEGKTTIVANLAISLAQVGKRVLLIDTDMRRPCLQKAFALSDSEGLASYLTGQRDWHAIVQPGGPEGLDALVCGPVPPNPAELLSSERMRSLMREAMAEYNFVLLDSPPLLDVADARILAPLVEGVVLVVQCGATPREVVQRAQAYARHVGANIIGVVLNKLDARTDAYYYHQYYRYDYYRRPEEPEENA